MSISEWCLFAAKPFIYVFLKEIQLLLWVIITAWDLFHRLISFLARRKRVDCWREQEREERARAGTGSLPFYYHYHYIDSIESVAREFAAENGYTGFQLLRDLGMFACARSATRL